MRVAHSDTNTSLGRIEMNTLRIICLERIPKLIKLIAAASLIFYSILTYSHFQIENGVATRDLIALMSLAVGIGLLISVFKTKEIKPRKETGYIFCIIEYTKAGLIVGLAILTLTILCATIFDFNNIISIIKSASFFLKETLLVTISAGLVYGVIIGLFNEFR